MVASVEDATEDLTIVVTAADCRKGIAKNHTQCPGALAAGRGADGAIISKRSAYVIKGRKAIRYRVPERLTREEVAVDRGGSFQPGTYVLSHPHKGERLTERKTGKTHNKSNRTSPSFTPHLTEGMRTTLGGRVHIS
jgi:hypothetical protein